MDHQSQLEKSKYRNWVRGGLAYKYLKEGIEGFADEVVIQEHTRILKAIGHTPGLICNQCSLRNLKPLHTSKQDLNTGKYVCPWSQTNCSCLFPKKRPCPNKVCDAILEEILKSHGSQPPTPNWKNTDIQKWCYSPWEVAKSFINAVGYSDKTMASDIDAPGLLHIFINNINLHASISCKITGTDAFNRVRQRRNDIFHSSKMELEDKEMNDLTDDVIEILEDEKELKRKHDAKQAVEKLRHLKREDFIITTQNEVEVCRAAMASIVVRSEELQQVIEETKSYIDSKESQVKQEADNAKADIDTKEKQVLRAIDDKTEQAKKELEKQNGSQLHEMQQTTELLKQIDYSYIKQHLLSSKRLVELYQTHYVKTWISPLKVQDNDININEVYVTPHMTVEEAKKSNTQEGGRKSQTATNRRDGSNEKLIASYSDIFQTGDLKHKRIYIVGDVGTGKSTFGKMIIHNWCRAIQSSDDETKYNPSTDKMLQTPDEVNNLQELRRFHFLFFISLQRMSGLNFGLAEMIKMHYKDEVSSNLLESILEEEPGRCLIIADGLDEWTPPKESIPPPHVSYGIPLGIRNATIITLSRPSAKGILNMKSTECDQKIKIHGINRTLVNVFISKYLSKQTGNNKTSVDDFLEKISEKNFEYLVKTPLFLQQLIWMYSMGHEIGMTVSSIYSNIVNSMFGWSKSKDDVGYITGDTSLIPEKYQQMKLPALLDRFPRCCENKRFLFLSGNIAFNAFTADIIGGRFGLSSLMEIGLTRNDINTLKSFGILVEYKCNDPTYEEVYFSFIHMSYLEFFAALYISCVSRKDTVLEELFKKYKRTDDILQLENVLKFVSGLSPSLIGEISKFIFNNVSDDEIIVKYRTTLHEYEYSPWEPPEAEQIQDLLYNCLCESGTNESHVVRVCDVVVSFTCDLSFLRKIIPDSVLSLCFDLQNEITNAEILKLVVQFHRLEYMYVRGTHHHNSQLASSIQQVKSIKHLTMKHMKCSSSNCNEHTIELSQHTKLQGIHLEDCTFQVSSLGNSNYLEDVYISYPPSPDFRVQHDRLCQLSSSLENAVSLKHLTMKDVECSSPDCNGHTFDLSQQNRLHSIHFEDCPFQVGSLGNSNYLENVYISYPFLRNLTVQHDRLGHLLTSLEKAVSLKQLTMKDIECSSPDCNGHTIDLSQQNQLHSIHLEDCTFQIGSLGNSNYLENVYISYPSLRNLTVQHDRLGQLLISLEKMVSLKHLKMKDIECSSPNCNDHTIDLSQQNQIHSIHFEDCLFQVGSLGNSKYLENFYISRPLFRELIVQHDMLIQLASSLAKAKFIKHLTVERLECSSSGCNRHTIDLSKHTQLQSIHFEDCPF